MKNTNLTIGLFFCIIIAFWGFCLLKVLTCSLPYNPISMSKKSRINLAMLIPQGWAFFTKDPREPSIAIYKNQEGKLTQAMPPNASSSNLFGALKRSRAMGIELGALSNQIVEEQWSICEQSINHCSSEEDSESIPVINRAYQPQFCGEYFISLEEPVPWAWSKSYYTVEMPCKFVKINSLCL